MAPTRATSTGIIALARSTTAAASEGARETGPLRLPRSLRSRLPALLVAVVAGVALARFALLQPDGTTAATGGRSIEAADVSSLDDPLLLRRLGVEHLNRFRETADPSLLSRSSAALQKADDLAPDVADTLVARGLLDLALHDFPAALERGQRAASLSPDSADPLGVVFDAQIELGRYDEAVTTAQQMVDLRPSLASLARVSYVRQLHGDTAGALQAMEAAAAAGSASAEDRAYVQTLLGDLHLGTGRLDRARAAYDRALAARRGHGLAGTGLARVDAASGRLPEARTRLAAVVGRLPLPSAVALLGDVEALASRPREAAEQYELVRSIERLNAAAGVAVDLELAAFDADHARDGGVDRDALVSRAAAARAARPTIYGDDVLAWTLRQVGRPAEALPHARAAVRLGTADALLWYHLAAVEADLGLREEARAHLERALTINPHLTPRDLPDAISLRESLR